MANFLDPDEVKAWLDGPGHAYDYDDNNQYAPTGRPEQACKEFVRALAAQPRSGDSVWDHDDEIIERHDAAVVVARLLRDALDGGGDEV